MTKLLIILTKTNLYVFERKSLKETHLIHLFGEKSIEWNPENYESIFLKFKNELIDIFNYSDLSNIVFNTLYEEIDTSILKSLTDKLTPCAGWQIFSFSRILPQILFNMKRLVNLNDRIHVEFNNEIYSVTVDKNNQVSVKKSYQTPHIRIEIKDIPRYINLMV